MIEPQKFINIKTLEIATQIPILEMSDWIEYNEDDNQNISGNDENVFTLDKS